MGTSRDDPAEPSDSGVSHEWPVPAVYIDEPLPIWVVVTNWHREIEELHHVFQEYFLGRIDSLDRVDASLAPSFTIVGPNGVESSRPETMAALRAGHNHTAELAITITEARLLVESHDTIIARYVENHILASRSNHRLTTVVFAKDENAPHGVQWLRAHETWIT